MMYLCDLFWSFLKIGFTSFGGLSMLPLISDEMLSHEWMTTEEVSNIVAIAEMTPGPLGINCATYVGMKTGGVLGAIVANLAVLIPTLTLCLMAAIFIRKFSSSAVVRNILVGIRPACIGLIIGVVLNLCLNNYTPFGRVSPAAVCIGLVDIILLLKLKMSVPAVIGLSAALGVLCYRMLPLC